jgi:hypothetical protein
MWPTTDAWHESLKGVGCCDRVASLVVDNVHSQLTTISFPWLAYPFGFLTVTLH